MLPTSLTPMLQFLKKHQAFIYIFLVLFGVYFIWWAAFFPGVMTADSLDQWSQAITGKYNDAHPFMSTIFMNTFRGIKDTPAWVSLVQVLATSGIIAGFLAYGIRKGLPKKAVIVCMAVFVIWPVYGIYSVTIWKDIIYSIAIMAVCLLCFVIVADKRLAAKRYPYVLLVIAALVVALWRHNGTIYLVLPFVGLWLFSKGLRKAATVSGITTIVLYLFIHFIVGSWLNVQPAPILAEWLRMKTVSAVYNEKHPTISTQDRKVFSSLMPQSDWKQAYNCVGTDTTFLKFYQYHPISYTNQVSTNPQVEAAWKKAVVDVALHNPYAVTKDHMCVGKTLFKSDPGFIKYSDSILIRTDLPFVAQHPVLHTNRFLVHEKAFLAWTAKSTVTNFIFWSALPVAALSIVYLGLAIKYRMKATIIFILLGVANPLCVIAIGSASDYRYIYNLVLSGPLTPLVFMVESRIRQGQATKHTGPKHSIKKS